MKKKNNPTRTERAAEPNWCCVMGLCEEVDSHRGANHAQAMLEEGSGGFMACLGLVVMKVLQEEEEVMEM